MEYLGHNAMPPPGSIMSYIGTSDPDGWIICDGILRTSTDSRYAALSVLLGGNADSITPPEEYALQTIVESENEHFYYIGNGVENEKHGPNDPNSDVLKFMYKVNREDFMNYTKYIFII